MGSDGRAHMSSHLGDMADPRTQACFDAALQHMAFITGRRPAVIACDLHPSYATTGWAHRQHLDVVAVQHHHAHAVSLMAEHDRLDAPMVAVAYDGTGYGTDGTIWGGELLVITDPARFTRAGHLAPFALPGGDGAVRNPARIALDLLHRAGIEWADDLAPVGAVGDAGVHILAQQISRGVGLVPTVEHGPAVRRRRQSARRLSAGHLRGAGGRRTRAPGPPRRPRTAGIRRRRRAARSGTADRRTRRGTAGRASIAPILPPASTPPSSMPPRPRRVRSRGRPASRRSGSPAACS